MNLDEIIKLIMNFGVPTAILLWVLWQMPSISNRISTAIDNNTDAIERNSMIMFKLCLKLGHETEADEFVKTALKEQKDNNNKKVA